jgi:serine/threonine protein kinase
MLDGIGDLKIADFGTARDISIDMTKEIGSLYYAAP